MCYRPNMMLFDTSQEPKQKLKFISSFNVESYEWFDHMNDQFKKAHLHREWLRVPCGQCIGCQEAYTKQWAVRCMLEASKFEHNYFLTLTYNDAHLPRDEIEIVNKNTGEIGEASELGCLNKRDLQLFMKRLRAYFKRHYDFEGIRFFACGEYGSEGSRPHYHIILFNCPLTIREDDLSVHSITSDKNIIWNSKTIEELWTDDKDESIGFSSVCEVNWDTCAYTARYCLKKIKGKISQDYYFDNGQIPEFTVMSRMPGIGRDFFEENFQKIYENDEILIKGHAEKIKPIKPPKYFDKIYQDIYPDEYKALVDRRKQCMLDNNKLKSKQTSLSEKEQLKVDMTSKEAKFKMFKLQRSKF